MNDTKQGVVKRIVADKGFGFIRSADGIERFFHRSAVDIMSGGFDALREGMSVTFVHVDGPKGPRAENVTPQFRSR